MLQICPVVLLKQVERPHKETKDGDCNDSLCPTRYRWRIYGPPRYCKKRGYDTGVNSDIEREDFSGPGASVLHFDLGLLKYVLF